MWWNLLPPVVWFSTPIFSSTLPWLRYSKQSSVFIDIFACRLLILNFEAALMMRSSVKFYDSSIRKVPFCSWLTSFFSQKRVFLDEFQNWEWRFKFPSLKNAFPQFVHLCCFLASVCTWLSCHPFWRTSLNTFGRFPLSHNDLHAVHRQPFHIFFYV